MDPNFTELAAALKTSVDVIKSLWPLSDSKSSEVHQKINELSAALGRAQNHALQLQISQANLLAEKEDLRSKLQALQSFEEEKRKYCLMQIQAGAVVYGLREEFVNGETQHYLCPNCFADGKKSFLQKVGLQRLFSLECSRCKLTART